MNISYVNANGLLIQAVVNLRVDNFIKGNVSHRRNLHRRLLGGFYVEADPKNWKGSFELICEDVSFAQINSLRDALNMTLTSVPAQFEWDGIFLLGNYIPDSLTVTSSGSLADKRFQRDISFSIEGKIVL